MNVGLGMGGDVWLCRCGLSRKMRSVLLFVMTHRWQATASIGCLHISIVAMSENVVTVRGGDKGAGAREAGKHVASFWNSRTRRDVHFRCWALWHGLQSTENVMYFFFFFFVLFFIDLFMGSSRRVYTYRSFL